MSKALITFGTPRGLVTVAVEHKPTEKEIVTNARRVLRLIDGFHRVEARKFSSTRKPTRRVKAKNFAKTRNPSKP